VDGLWSGHDRSRRPARRRSVATRGHGNDASFSAWKVTTVDGPFAETKEQLGGYYIIDVPDLDSALKWAKQCPVLFSDSSVEVRPLVSHDRA